MRSALQGSFRDGLGVGNGRDAYHRFTPLRLWHFSNQFCLLPVGGVYVSLCGHSYLWGCEQDTHADDIKAGKRRHRKGLGKSSLQWQNQH